MNLNRTTITAFAITALLGGTAVAEEPNAHGDHLDATQVQPAGAEQPEPHDATEARAGRAAPEGDTRANEVTHMDRELVRPTAGAAASGGVRLSDLDAAQIETLQEALKDHGYYTGEVDGIVGPLTQRALGAFYRDQARLAAAGMIMPQSAEMLGVDASEIERVRGEGSIERQTLRGEDTPDPQDQRMQNEEMRDEALDQDGVTEGDEYEEDMPESDRAYE